MNERERRDYDLARRLALETGGEADLPYLQRSRRQAANSKYDLGKHTYAQLRDIINTSCGKNLNLKKKETLVETKLFRFGIT